MNNQGIDPVTRVLAAVPSRRHLLRGLNGGLAYLLAVTETEARRRKRPRKKRRHKNTPPGQPEEPRPTEQFDANCPAQSGAAHVANIPALTFVPRRTGLLTRARVLLDEHQDGQEFTLYLTRVDAAGLPTEAVLASEEVRGLPPTEPGNTPLPLTATFARPAFVFKGTRYALIILSAQGFRLVLGQSEQCPDSLAYDDTNRDGVFTPFPDRDFAFATFVSGIV